MSKSFKRKATAAAAAVTTPATAPALPPPATPSNGSRRIPPEVVKATTDRMRSASMALGWKFPFFLPAIARIDYRVDMRIPTACICLKGIVRGNPEFIKNCSDLELQFVMAHELFHLLLLHHDRRGHRKPYKWNRAGDRIINTTLQRIAQSAGAGSIVAPKDLLYAEAGQEEWTAEQLYQEEEDRPEDDGGGYDPSQVPVGQGCGPMPAEPGDAKDANGQPMGEDTLRRQWREIAAQAQMTGRQAGNVEGNILADLLDIPPPKVRWSEVLRGQLYRALAESGHDDTTWTRRSRRSTTEIILPGGTTYKCKAAVVIDTSGSMSDEDLQHAVAETAAIVNHTRVSTFLVVHDHCVQAVHWITPGAKAQVNAQIRKRMKGRGGTSFDDAYARVEKEGKFNALVHLTDGEVGSWPAKPRTVRKLVVALLGSACKTEVPTDARVIEVEL